MTASTPGYPLPLIRRDSDLTTVRLFLILCLMTIPISLFGSMDLWPFGAHLNDNPFVFLFKSLGHGLVILPLVGKLFVGLLALLVVLRLIRGWAVRRVARELWDMMPQSLRDLDAAAEHALVRNVMHQSVFIGPEKALLGTNPQNDEARWHAARLFLTERALIAQETLIKRLADLSTRYWGAALTENRHRRRLMLEAALAEPVIARHQADLLDIIRRLKGGA